MRSFAATPAEVLPIFVIRRLGQRILSTLPAYQAAGIIASDSTTKADEADAPPIALIEYLPERRRQQRAERSAPTPGPSTVERTVAGTARAATDIRDCGCSARQRHADSARRRRS